MTKQTYTLLKNFMLSCMDHSAHDKEHVYRVLYQALEIAETEATVDYDVLIAACLLHDIGRQAQLKDPNLCHAAEGAKMAYNFLLEQGFGEDFACKVSHCIQAHRFSNRFPPESLEAKILFDADKLDVTGAMGIARTLLYQGSLDQPLYSLLPDGSVSDGTEDTAPSFFQEYKRKLERLYDTFYTAKGRQLAQARKADAVAFYQALYDQTISAYHQGTTLLETKIR